MDELTPNNIFILTMLKNKPDATASINGSSDNPELGEVNFYKTQFGGIIVNAEIYGLPQSSDFYGFHIHENGDCTPPFDKTGEHYNPDNLLTRSMQGICPRFLAAKDMRGSVFMTTASQ